LQTTEEEVAVIVASIKAVGLLQDMAGLQTKDGIQIVFGGRRMRALQKLVIDDNDPAMSVEVIMAKDEREAVAWAGTENSVRSQPHPADEIIAYKKSVELGALEDQIAKAFGVTVRHVKGRLKLAGLAPVILDALRADEITLDVAAAYTLTDDQIKQAESFEQFGNSWIGRDPSEIKSRLNEEAVEADDSVAKFVTREVYETAGGKINEDLFGEEVFFLDSELLHKLADEKLETVKAEFENQGWKWVETLSESPSWDAMRSYGDLHPKTVPFNEEDEANYNELAALIEAGNAQDADVEAFEEMEKRLNTRIYLDEQKAHSGVFFWIGYNGEISSNVGYVAPDDIKAAIEAGVLEAARPASTPAKKKGPYPEALQRDMATIRTAALQTAFLRDEAFALDVLFFALTSSIWSDSNPIGLSMANKKIHVEGDDGLTIPEVLDTAGNPQTMNAETAALGFAQFRELPKKLKMSMMVENLSRTLSASISLPDNINPLVEALAVTTKANPREIWTPTTSFLKRLTSPQLDEVMAFIKGEHAGANFCGMKKMDKVARLHALFNNEEDRKGQSKEALKRIATWIPQGFENIDLAVGELPKDAKASEEEITDIAA